MTRPRRVALLIESSRGYGRGLLHGIAEYLRSCAPWTLSFERHGLYQRVPAWLLDWRGDGIIARVENRRLAKAIHQLRVPSVGMTVPAVFLLSRRVSKPLGQLHDALDAIGEGKFDTRLDTSSHDEFGDVALSHFARRMAQLDPERRAALERLAREG